MKENDFSPSDLENSPGGAGENSSITTCCCPGYFLFPCEFSSLDTNLKVLQDDIVRDSKNFKNKKLQNVKKQTDHMEIIQKDLQNCIQDFCKAKTVYQEEGDDKTNNKILKKNTKRIKPSANTTNAYVLALLTANTHQVTVSIDKICNQLRFSDDKLWLRQH